MNAKPIAADLAVPRGVIIRAFKHEKRIQIAFSYRGTECRELLPPQRLTQQAVHQATALRAEIIRRIAEDRFTYHEYFPGSPRALLFKHGHRVMLADCLRETEKSYERQVANNKLSPSTLAGYKYAINCDRMQEFVRGRPIAEVMPSEIRAFVAGVVGTAKHIRNMLTPLRATFADALNDDLITIDPFSRIDMAALLRRSAKESDYEALPFTAQERDELLRAAQPAEMALVRFWLNTGLRPGELIALRWSKVDWANRKVRIDLNQVVGVEKTPKTSAGIRDVDLNDEALEALAAQKPPLIDTTGHVFTNPLRGGNWATDAQLRRKLWIPLMQRAAVRYRNPYQCRHTFASALLTAGHNPWYVAQQLGHVDVQLVYRTYGKFIMEDYQKPGVMLPRAPGRG